MARKSNAFKTSPEARGSAGLDRRQPMPSTTALYLAQLRQHVFRVPPRARQQIAVQIEEQSQTPRVVKIIHTDSI
jgi:hypothetical protein